MLTSRRPYASMARRKASEERLRPSVIDSMTSYCPLTSRLTTIAAGVTRSEVRLRSVPKVPPVARSSQFSVEIESEPKHEVDIRGGYRVAANARRYAGRL